MSEACVGQRCAKTLGDAIELGQIRFDDCLPNYHSRWVNGIGVDEVATHDNSNGLDDVARRWQIIQHLAVW